MSMSRLAFVTISIAALCCLTPAFAKVGVQQERATYGPVVKAYLTGLAEELSELEYQLRHREINRPDYDRAKHRLTILRRFVERLAAQSVEDLVPELQILTDDELGTLGLNSLPNPNELETGNQLDGQWELIGIERVRMRFFVFKRLSATEIVAPESATLERKLGRKIDPQEVIETIVVRERPTTLPQPRTNDIADHAPRTPENKKSLPAEPVETAEQKPQLQLPRILHVYLPQYTDKARNNGIEGELVVRALFQSDGKIKNLKVEKGLGHGLDQRAIESVRRIGFLPAQIEGQAVDTYAQIIFNFKFGKVTFYLKASEMKASLQGAKP
jgi:protein TonB